MKLFWILLAYALFWIFWWVLVPVVKVIALWAKYDVKYVDEDNFVSNIIFTAKFGSQKVKIVTDFDGTKYSGKLKRDMYLYHDFIKYALTTAANAIKIDPNMKVIDIYYSNFKSGEGVQNV